jgi:hypothetical protein
MVIVCDPENRGPLKAHFEALGERCYEIGAVVEGNREVSIA